MHVSRHSLSSHLQWDVGPKSRSRRILWRLCGAHPVHSLKATFGFKNMCTTSEETQSQVKIKWDKILHRVRLFSSKWHRSLRNFRDNKARWDFHREHRVPRKETLVLRCEILNLKMYELQVQFKSIVRRQWQVTAQCQQVYHLRQCLQSLSQWSHSLRKHRIKAINNRWASSSHRHKSTRFQSSKIISHSQHSKSTRCQFNNKHLHQVAVESYWAQCPINRSSKPNSMWVTLQPPPANLCWISYCFSWDLSTSRHRWAKTIKSICWASSRRLGCQRKKL